MKLQSGETLFTLKELAEIISYNQTEIGITRAMRQLRHWTQNDLLKTVTVKNTGKGIPRLYAEEPTMLISAILLELSRYGATIETMRPVAAALYDDWEGDGGYYQLLALTDHPSMIQVIWEVAPETGEFCGAKVEFVEDYPKSETPRTLLSELDYDASSSLLLNMTNIAERIWNRIWQTRESA